MMESPPLETVYQAISALYDNPNAVEKEKASIWLGDVQKSLHSWKIADNLLQQKKDIQSCYFAAQTMRSKVQHNLAELPPEAVVSLRDSLIIHLEGISPETSSPILTQLSLALADLALQTPSWENFTRDLISSFMNKNNFALLELLTVIPQEIDSSVLKLGENRRSDIKRELKSNSQIVTLFLKECLSTSHTQVALKVVKCMTSWIQVSAVNLQELQENAVVGFCLQVLMDHESVNMLHEVASDCICALLDCMDDNSADDNVSKLLFDSVLGLESCYHMSVANEEEVKSANYARVFTELAESFLEKIIMCASNGETHFSMRSLELVLITVGHHDYDVAEISFNLWYRLSEEVYQRDYQPLTDMFKPYIERLIAALARHCQCEPDLQQLPEEGDDFYEFRQKVQELIKDVVFIAGSSSVFRQMFTAIADTTCSWEQTEAALYVMQAVAKNIIPEEYEYVPKVIEAVLSMPTNAHLGVRHTCMALLGGLCEWIQRHPECLPPVMAMLVQALTTPALASVAANSLQAISAACRGDSSLQWQQLLEALRGCSSTRSTPASLAVSVALARAVSTAIGKLPPEELTPAMREAVSIEVSGLQSALTLGSSSAAHAVHWLDGIAALFRDVRVEPENAACLLPAMQDAWPVLQDTMDKCGACSRVCERWCRAVRFMLRAARRAGAALLPALQPQLPALYQAHAHSALLYLTSVLVDELYAEPGAPELLALMGSALVPSALAVLANGLRDHPDTVDDLFRLAVRFVQRIPREFLSLGVWRGLVPCACAATRLDHRDANASVMKLLYDVTRAANLPRTSHRAHIKDLADEIMVCYAEEITSALVEAAAIHLHSYMLAEVAEVLMELFIWQKGKQLDYLKTALMRLPRGQASATEQQCAQFHHYALSATQSKELMKLLKNFSKLYR